MYQFNKLFLKYTSHSHVMNELNVFIVAMLLVLMFFIFIRYSQDSEMHNSYWYLVSMYMMLQFIVQIGKVPECLAFRHPNNVMDHSVETEFGSFGENSTDTGALGYLGFPCYQCLCLCWAVPQFFIFLTFSIVD